MPSETEGDGDAGWREEEAASEERGPSLSWVDAYLQGLGPEGWQQQSAREARMKAQVASYFIGDG